ncbi:MAG: hypothetical protein QXT63_07540, partial [Thermoplasmata archaeon]
DKTKTPPPPYQYTYPNAFPSQYQQYPGTYSTLYPNQYPSQVYVPPPPPPPPQMEHPNYGYPPQYPPIYIQPYAPAQYLAYPPPPPPPPPPENTSSAKYDNPYFKK